MEEIDLKELFLIFWNKKVEIILITIFAMLIGAFYSYFYITPEYKSSTKLVLAQSTSEKELNSDGAITQADVNLNSKLVSTYSEIIKSKTILREVVNNLNISGLNESNLRKNISVQSVKDTEVIEITVKNLDPKIAAEVANKIADVFSEKVVEIYNISNVYILDRAEPNETPSNINHSKDIIIFAFIGIVISVGIILIVNMLDTTVKAEDDIENITGLLILSSIPNYNPEQKKKGRSRR